MMFNILVSMKRVGVILCGCGRFDGSEIQEAVCTLLHLAKAGAEVRCFAPDALQWAVCEHFDGGIQAGENRHQMEESARIFRGPVENLAAAQADDLDALILPGGAGAARNLCNYAEKGDDGTVIPDLAQLIRAMHHAGKPIGAICIAPAIVGLALDGKSLPLEACAADEIQVDENRKIVTTPAYVLAENIAQVSTGISKLVAEVLKMA